ncbi:uncharacterized protein SPPG_09156 [Spizellomyces punctatus DAOM BR117]|uniref:Coiled-coil domain-containing protein n=1 Tax=Spizellomyces punctatus (strain DAOM BR117) TaxID=645134 RepID=A0A0L0HIS8_SPIPD|nr:uncharacterized protein SPPG_09156 [Spizellomyces punctatus DAOM BR117]KND00795.1 hypothetical protein SPPG_09156 [Spizellomyces punctatus DAOM BR117]|eukprot:XP_016608834.1 hypothetical protein SPPG_09156 [Spizellomyces punctatus DAOM BR117]
MSNDDANSVSSSEFSVLDALSGSEKFVKGNITFDWRGLPPNIVAALPDPPPSAKRYLKRRVKNGTDDIFSRNQTYISDKVAEWASRSQKNEDIQASRQEATENPFILEAKAIEPEHTQRPFPLADVQSKDPEKVYTFNNCQFSYAGNGKNDAFRQADESVAVEEKPVASHSIVVDSRDSTERLLNTGELGAQHHTRNRDVSASKIIPEGEPNGDILDLGNDELGRLFEQLHLIKSGAEKIAHNRKSVHEHERRGHSLLHEAKGRKYKYSLTHSADEPELSLTDLAASEKPRTERPPEPAPFEPHQNPIPGRSMSLEDSRGRGRPVRSSQRDGLTRETHQRMLLKIHSELSELAHRLKKKRRAADLKEQQLAAKERHLQTRETHILKEVEKLVTLRLAKKEEVLKKDAEVIVEQYDDALTTTVKENKRLQASLRDLIAVNRQMREQVSKLQEDAWERERELEEQRNQLKHSRDRNLRLKAALAIGRANSSTAIVSVKKEQASKLEEAKKIILTQGRKTTRNARTVETQTLNVEESIRSGDDLRSKLSGLQKMLAYLLQTRCARTRNHRQAAEGTNANSENIGALHEAIASTFCHVTQTEDRDSPKNVVDCERASWIEYYLQFVLECMLRVGFSAAQKYIISVMAYEAFTGYIRGTSINVQPSDGSHKRSPPLLVQEQTTRLVLCLIILSGVTQIDVITAILDNIAAELSTDEGKGIFLKANGVDVVHMCLRDVGHDNVQHLASSIFLTLCAEGDWLVDFIGQCSTVDVLDSIIVALDSSNLGTLENISVVLQKISKLSENRTSLRERPDLVPRLKAIIDGTEEASIVSPLSEFLMINIRSILANVDNTITVI